MSIPVSYDHSPIELIRSRTSIRRFDGKPLEGPAREELARCCQDATRGPFGTPCRFKLVDTVQADSEAGERFGTYGVIRGARTYLVSATQAGAHGLEDLGFLLELLVLKAVDLGLGSCWLGALITRGRFARALGLRDGEILPAVSPIGTPTQKRGVLDQVIRWGAGSSSRKSWVELFFDHGDGEPLSRQRAGGLATALEMVRLAPSASNRQPWRLRVGGQDVHFYMQRTPGYGALTAMDLQRIDMGIAMAHFQLAMAEAGITGQWKVVDPQPLDASGAAPESPQDAVERSREKWQKARYLVSWVQNPPRAEAADSRPARGYDP